MRILAIFLLLAVAWISLASSPNPIPSSLPFQAHSFNDLDIARHLLNKKVKYFKFDASLANHQSCSGYSSWKERNQCINLEEYAEDMCCIAMRGDASSEPNFYYPFNTSAEFVTLIGDYLVDHESQVDFLLVAIDFQFSFSFANSLAQEFMYDLATLMNRYPMLHVCTKGNYIFEYDRVCRFSQSHSNSQEGQFGSVESIGCTPERSHISKSRFFLQSGSIYPYDERDYKGRFQNFNTIWADIDRLCAQGFPTWPNKYPQFPLIFWEPSNQMQIQEALAKLMSPECQKKHNRSLSGIALASNIDPEMFELAMKTTTAKTGSNDWQLDTHKQFTENVVDLKMAKITVNNEEKMVTYRKVVTNGTTKHLLSLFQMKSLSPIVSLEKEVAINDEVIQLLGVGSTVVLITSEGRKQGQREFNALLVSYNQDLQAQNSLGVQDMVIAYTEANSLFYLSVSTNENVVIIYKTDSTLSKPVQHGLPVDLTDEKIQSISSAYSARMNSADEFNLLLVGNTGNKTWIADLRNGAVHAERLLAFGTNAYISKGMDGAVIVVLENSNTHGGLLMNNNGENSCLYHKTEILKPLATIPDLVNAVEAPLDTFLAFIADEQDQQMLTACHPTISISKHFNGAQTETLSIWGRLLFSTRFIPITQQPFVTTVFSGGSNFELSLREKKGFLLMSRTQDYSSLSIIGTHRPVTVQQ